MVSLLVQLTISHFTVLSNVSHSHLKVHIGVKEYLTRHKKSPRVGTVLRIPASKNRVETYMGYILERAEGIWTTACSK